MRALCCGRPSDVKQTMIPTCYKAKLSRQQSYPIGAEALTEGLAGAPHLDAFSVWFSSGWRLQKLLARRVPYTILTAEYRRPRKMGYIRADDEEWRLTIYPVIRELRHSANRLLREVGLLLVTQWLRPSEQASWLFRDQRIELVFDPVAESLSSQEATGV